jgi:hypothetical protein
MFRKRVEESHGLSWTSFAIGFAAGLGAYFLLDPRRGAARRAMMRDRAASGLRDAAESALRKARWAQDRARGVAHEVRARAREEHVADDVLVERVRAQIGRPVSHPGALDVQAQDGTVVLSGNILRREVDDLISRVGKIRGVRQVESRLTVHDQPGDVPDLQ